jgi:hypothetical protein
LKHEKIIEAVVDRVPAAFVRSLAICLVAGAACWGALISVLA